MAPHFKVLTAVLFAATCATTCLVPAAEPPHAIQGKWQILSIAFEDKVLRRENPLEWKEAFQNDVLIRGDQLSQAGGGQGTFTLDDSRSPKQITVRDAEGKLAFRGIYAVQGDVLKVCFDGDGKSVRRPEEFATQKGTPLIVLELQRMNERK